MTGRFAGNGLGARLGVWIAAGLVTASCGSGSEPGANRTATPAVATARALAVGDPAPEFSLPGTDGRQYSLAGFRGKQTVVLAWFTKAFTEG
jgi:AhpC/TSA family